MTASEKREILTLSNQLIHTEAAVQRYFLGKKCFENMQENNTHAEVRF